MGYPDWTNWEWNLAGSDRKKRGDEVYGHYTS
jgi:hypothetical protein